LSRALVAVVMSVLFIAAWRFARGVQNTGEEIWVVIVAILLTLSAPAQRLFAALIDPYLYRGRIDYPVAVREAMHRLSRFMPVEKLRAHLIEILDTACKPESITPFFIKDEPDADSEFEPIVRSALQLLSDAKDSSVIVIDPGGFDTNQTP